MIEDARSIPDGPRLAADICIVGAGAAGISLALDLIDSGLTVLLLEAGGLHAESESQALYAGTVADAALHSPPDRYRERRFGGSTTIWGGRCTPLDAVDFESPVDRPYGGWPLTLDELTPYYRRANALCEAGEYAYTVESTFAAPRRPMLRGLRSSHFSTNTLERFSCPTDFGRRYARPLNAATDLRILLHANVTRLQLDASGQRIVEVGFCTLGGRVFSVSAGRVVLAAGGLEIPRLLLANRDVHPQGIGNGHDQVGRYYMCHLAGTIGTLKLVVPLDAVWHGYDVADDGVYCRRRLALRPEAQAAEGIGNFIARLHHPRIAEPQHRSGILSLLYLARRFIPWEYARRLGEDGPRHPALWRRHVRNVLGDLPRTIAFAWHLLRDRRLAERKYPSLIVASRGNRYSIDFHAEQEPQPESRVRLGTALDVLGQPQLHIDWRYSALDLRTVTRSLALLAQDIARCGLGRLDYDPANVEREMIRYGAYGGHHLGTARMGLDPATSVTDAQGRVHGIDNLYVAGSALFPTSSQANPTLTIVALALRLGAHLRGRAVADPPASRDARVAPPSQQELA